MASEQLGRGFFMFVAKARLKTLRIVPCYHEIDEERLMAIIAVEANWPSDRVYRAFTFCDAASAARYEMNTRKSGWEWTGTGKSSGLVLWNVSLHKLTGRNEFDAFIVRTGDSEWRVYKAEN